MVPSYQAKVEKGSSSATPGIFVANLHSESDQVDTLTLEQKVEAIRAFLPPTVLQLFEQRARGIPYEQLAREQGISEQAVKQLMYRWRKNLKTHLKTL